MKNVFVVDTFSDVFHPVEDTIIECWTDEGVDFSEEYNDVPPDANVTHRISLVDLVAFYLKYHDSLPETLKESMADVDTDTDEEEED